MSRRDSEQRVDARLERLLEVERRLEAKIQAAEGEAGALVAAARATQEDPATEERDAAAAVQAEEAAHAARLESLHTAGGAELAALAAISAARIDAWAEMILARALEPDSPGGRR